MIGRSGERGSGISVLAARHDDDGDIPHELENFGPIIVPYGCVEVTTFSFRYLYTILVI